MDNSSSLTLSNLPPDVISAKQRLGIVGNTPALIEAVQRAIKVAPIDLSVLVTGESGSGKEFFPQIIHQFSARKHAKYIAVNCGAIPEGTIDSELFGHEKGSFTGAVATRKGYFEEADGGTIFLDEVAELPLTTQARLLRVLETGEFLKVGSSQVQRTNIRVVAATNVDMAKAVAEGRFREDLFYRLSTVQIAVPPLRVRGNDIILLARKFANDFSDRYRTPAITIGDDAKRLLLSYQWPGNVRQLKNAIEQLALFEAGTNISMETVARYLPEAPVPSSASFTPALRTHSYEQEREMLFSLIFRLQRELAELKSQINGDPETKISRPADAPRSRALVPFVSSHASSSVVDVAPVVEDNPLPVESTLAQKNDVKPQPLSLEDTEKELIRDSLRRNDGRRKAVAKELKISERTLYRKIKEYNLE